MFDRLVRYRTWWRWRPAAAVALLAGLAVGGCSHPSAGTAAQVGDTVITVAEVERYVEDYAEESGQESLEGQQAAEATRAIVQRRIAMALIDQVAPEFDVSLTEAELAENVESLESNLAEAPAGQYQQFVAQNYVTQATLRESIRWDTLQQRVYQQIAGDANPQSQEEADQLQTRLNEEVAAAAERVGADVEVNPRYGSWDWEANQVVPDGQSLVDLNEQQDSAAQEPGPAPQPPAPQQ